jgi:hypothetical protein
MLDAPACTRPPGMRNEYGPQQFAAEDEGRFVTVRHERVQV